MNRSPAASTATPVGWSSSLAVAARPSPLKPAAPVPATVTAVRDPRPGPPGRVARWPRRCRRRPARRRPRRRVADGAPARARAPGERGGASRPEVQAVEDVPARAGTTRTGSARCRRRRGRRPHRARCRPGSPAARAQHGAHAPASLPAAVPRSAGPPPRRRAQRARRARPGPRGVGARRTSCRLRRRRARTARHSGRRSRPRTHARTDRDREGGRRARTRRGPQRRERHVHRLRRGARSTPTRPSRPATGPSPGSSSSTTCRAGTRGPRRSRGASPPRLQRPLPQPLRPPGARCRSRRRRGRHPRGGWHPRRPVRRRRRRRGRGAACAAHVQRQGRRHRLLLGRTALLPDRGERARRCGGRLLRGLRDRHRPRRLPAQGDAARRPDARSSAARCSASSATTTSSPAPNRWTSWRRR